MNEVPLEDKRKRDADWIKHANEERTVFERAHQTIWSPITWMHHSQIQDDFLLFATIQDISSHTKNDFMQITQEMLSEDKNIMENVLHNHRRIAMLHDLDYMYEPNDNGIETPLDPVLDFYRHLTPPNIKPM